MNSLKIFFFLTMVMALASTPSEGEFLPTNDNEASSLAANNSDASASEGEEFTSLRGTSRFLAGHIPSRVMTCKTDPRVCLVEGGPGPDCCKNKCVDMQRDAFNCGKCGKKCSHRKICCKGKCVNPMTNEHHCGKCGNKCHEGSSCLYGMCNYA